MTGSTRLDADIGDVLTSMVQHFDEELFRLSETELLAQWFFTWDERGDTAWNIYQFSSMLEIHKRRCRRWEERHNGSESVVERVRDKYLMPRIKEFVADLTRQLDQHHD